MLDCASLAERPDIRNLGVVQIAYRRLINRVMSCRGAVLTCHMAFATVTLQTALPVAYGYTNAMCVVVKPGMAWSDVVIWLDVIAHRLRGVGGRKEDQDQGLGRLTPSTKLADDDVTRHHGWVRPWSSPPSIPL